jgi:hypothetical protein
MSSGLGQQVEVEFDYNDVPTIKRFAMSNKRIRALSGPVGSGKSSGCAIELIRRGHEQAPSPVDGIRRTRWAVVRSTYRQLDDTTIKTVHHWLPPDRFGFWHKTDHNYVINAFPGVEIELMFRALDRPDQLSNLLSLEITGAWLNEYREIPRQIFDVLDTRCGRYPPMVHGGATWAGIIMDTNPPDEYNYYYKYFEKIKPANAQLWKQPSGLSPNAENLRNLPRNYYKNLAMGKDDAFINVYIHGLYGYVVEGKAVYAKCYNDNTHVSGNKLEPIKGLPLIAGFDFGLNPSVVIGQVLPTSRVLILRSLSSDGMGLENFMLNQIMPMLQMEFFGFKLIGFGDPAGSQRSQTDERTCYDIFRSEKISLHNIEPAPTNNLVARQRAAEYQLNRSVGGEQAVVIDPSCDLLRKALSSGYRFKKMPGIEEQYSAVPEKNFYCVDYMTRILTPKGWKRHSQLEIGEEVFGFKDGRVVLDKLLAINLFPGEIPAIKFMTSRNRDELIFTPNHRCYVYGRGKHPFIEEARNVTKSNKFVTMNIDPITGILNKLRILKKKEVIIDGVWCPTTTTGFWLAKRGQAIALTGNSHIANAFEYMCMYIENQRERDERADMLKKQLGQRSHHVPTSRLAGY